MAVALVRDEIKASCEARAGLYWFFSSLFAAELSLQGLASLKNGEGYDLLQALTDEPELAKASRALLRRLDLLAEDERTLLELRAEYTQLFLLDYRRGAPPYASVYSNGEHLLFQAPHRSMQALLEGEGLSVSKNFNEPADHLAIELDYLGNLIIRTLAMPTEQALKAQLGFIEAQLGWYGRFYERVQAQQAEGFYPELTRLLGCFLDADRNWLQAVLTDKAR